jgi:hypothetical protein
MINEVIKDLESFGYTNYKKKSKKTLIVFTDNKRLDVINDITSKLIHSVYDRTPTSTSSLGLIKDVRGISIIVKPNGKQGVCSAGIENEQTLVDNINKYTTNNPINIRFFDNNIEYIITNVISASGVGTSTAGRKKADVKIHTLYGEYNISLKKDNAEYWESADTLFRTQAERHINELKNSNKIEIKQHELGYFTITPNIAIKATPEQVKDVVFGSDILNCGAVITRTFNSNDFLFLDNQLTISCSSIITSPDNIPEDKQVWFLIRNDKTRTSGVYRGLRVLASYEKRLNPNVLRVF